MAKRVALTTIDNPFNPIKNFGEWYAYDMSMGYDTCGYLARVTVSSDELTNVEQTEAEVAAIHEIIRYNINGLYTVVTEDEDELVTTE